MGRPAGEINHRTNLPAERRRGWRRGAEAPIPCLGIPYRSPAGSPLGYVRCKPDHPRVKGGKPIKYESPVGQPNRAYFPPRTGAVLPDPDAPLLLTEGEKKA